MAIAFQSAPSTAFRSVQSAIFAHLTQFADYAEHWLELERDQLALWVPVALGTGIGLWFALASQPAWIAVICTGLALGLLGFLCGIHRRLGRCISLFGLLMALGCALIWLRAWSVRAPILPRATIAQFNGTIESMDVQGARQRVRLTIATQTPGLPTLLRVNVDDQNVPLHLVAGERVQIRARLLPPPEASLPGGYNFARGAWFMGLGATGHALGPVRRLDIPTQHGDTWHDQLTRLMLKRMPGSPGGIGASFISGDRGAISPHDEDSMRASGLTHLVSVSGLHITVAVTAAMWIVLRVLALIPGLALRWPLLAIAAASGAGMGLFYTWLTGAEVPTIRSCVAALLVILGLVLGREAVTLRLVASGAIVVLILWPESLVGPSFQLSFIAVTSIISFHEHPWVRSRFAAREQEGFWGKMWREGMILVVTGAVVEGALAPIAFFHFHRSGIYGMFANIIGIPLTTFFIMPTEAIALVFEPVHLSAPFWWLALMGLKFLVWISDTVSAWPGAVTLIPDVPILAFALLSYGGLWLMLWKSKGRFWGFLPVVAAIIWVVSLAPPDVLVTGDGRHMVVRQKDGHLAILRAKAHDFVRNQLAMRGGDLAPMVALDATGNADCNPDLCRVRLGDGQSQAIIIATRRDYNLPWEPFIRLCNSSDIFVSDRFLPRACVPKWLKIDRHMLLETGGLAITLRTHHIDAVKMPHDDHPWALKPAQTAYRRRFEAIGD